MFQYLSTVSSCVLDFNPIRSRQFLLFSVHFDLFSAHDSSQSRSSVQIHLQPSQSQSSLTNICAQESTQSTDVTCPSGGFFLSEGSQSAERQHRILEVRFCCLAQVPCQISHRWYAVFMPNRLKPPSMETSFPFTNKLRRAFRGSLLNCNYFVFLNAVKVQCANTDTWRWDQGLLNGCCQGFYYTNVTLTCLLFCSKCCLSVAPLGCALRDKKIFKTCREFSV